MTESSRRSKAEKQETASETPSVVPREPETEKGKRARSQYLAFAKSVLKAEFPDYLALFREYAKNDPDAQQSAQALDRSVAIAILQAGNPPRQVISILAQGPFTQYQTRDLTPDEKRAALPKLLHYAKTVVEDAQRQRFVDYANRVTSKIQTYPDLYRTHLDSDLSAIQLDQKVTAAALIDGDTPESVAALLLQGPYAQFQREVRQMSGEAIEQYAKGTVSQVQAIQSIQSPGVARSRRSPDQTQEI